MSPSRLKPGAVAPPGLAADADPEQTLADIRYALAPKPKPGNVNAIDPALLTKSKRAFESRQRSISSKLPMARVRRTLRRSSIVVLLAVLLAGFLFRTEIVRQFPSLAGLYAAVGLPVNVVGLEFADSKIVTSLRTGKIVMLITSRIRSVASQRVSVPPVLVSLLDADGAIVYEWTVTPRASLMDPGESLEFSTEVNAPPQGAVAVRLTFTNGRSDNAAPAGIL